MTWSIIARETRRGQIGLAEASRFFALGARIPFLEGGVGAVATQALVNQLYGRKGLDLPPQGCSARHVNPIGELARLEAVSRTRWVHFRRFLPKRENPVGITDRARIEVEIAEALAREAVDSP